MSYEDSVLIKLRRDYGKYESMLFALNKIKELQIENGKNKAYIDELQDEKKKSSPKELHSKIKDLENQVKILKENSLKLKNPNINLTHVSKEVHKKKVESLERKLESHFLRAEHGENESKYMFYKIKDVLSESQLEYFQEELKIWRKNSKEESRGNVLKSMNK